MASLLDNHLGFKFTRVRTIVRIPWISPLRGLNPQPTRRGPSQTPLLLVFIGSVVSIQTCTVWAPGPNPHSVSKSVGIVLTLTHSLRWGFFYQQAMCIPTCPCPTIAGLQYTGLPVQTSELLIFAIQEISKFVQLPPEKGGGSAKQLNLNSY